MRQLTGLDTQFLAIESPHQPAHVGSLIVLDPSTRPGGAFTIENLQDLLVERSPLLLPFRWRLRHVPFDLDYPYWVEDPDFDVEYHVRELAIPAPPTDAKLAEQVARIAARPLDRSRPLWELYLIHGLADGRVAVLTKVHHAAIDGMSGAEILSAVLDLTPDGREIEAPITDPAPAEPVNLVGQGITAGPRYIARVLRALPRLLPNVEHSPLTALPGMRPLGRAASAIDKAIRRESGVIERSSITPPKTSFNTVVSAHRRFAFGELSLDRVKQVKNAHGCTVNDVVMAMCAGALRRWLIVHDELPDGPLVAQVPVSVRTEDELGTYGNKIGVMSPPLHVEEPDPLRRLMLTHESMKSAKEQHKALPASLLRDASEFIPPALFARAARIGMALGARGTPIWNLVISNVPGPPVPLYLAGARVETMYPVSVITDGLGMNITVFSYQDELNFGIIVDRETVPDVWDLIGWLGESLDELVATIPAEKPPRAPRKRTRAAAD